MASDATSHPLLAYRAFWQPKRGHDEADYEDAYRVSASGPEASRAAIADGATESAFARLWATMLVEGLVDEGAIDPERFTQQLPLWQTMWIETIDQRSQGLPWYAAQKAEEGAFATALGLALEPGGTWRALSVGDCCLFHLRDGAVQSTWPATDPDAFTNRPALVPSRRGPAVPTPAVQTGTWAPGDRFLLATDATAAWLLRAGIGVLDDLDAEAFAQCVRIARTAGTLRNDDVTLVDLRILA